ncbi:MAG TPA: SAM-dependent methyltransferase [Vicinamibacterales bacterium]
MGVAWLRAAHQVLDAPPLVLDDPAALALLGPDAADRIRREAARVQGPGARALRSHVVLRSRFAEDRLRAAVGRGVTQYIVLGAGYDTFCVRQPAWARQLRVIEVDRRTTQSGKKARLAEAGLNVPGNVVFADVDFETETLLEGLVRHDVGLDVPTFFSWLGVTVYLTEPAIDGVFRTVASCPPESEVVFTYSPAESGPDPTGSHHEISGLAARAAEAGEPWLTHFEPEVLDRKLRAIGFRDITFLTPEDAATRYFRGRADDLPPPRRTTIAAAIR